MLEKLLWETIPDGARQCTDSFFGCVTESSGLPVRNPRRTRTSAYLATQRQPRLSVGYSARGRYWDLNHPALAEIRSFVRGIYTDGSRTPVV